MKILSTFLCVFIFSSLVFAANNPKDALLLQSGKIYPTDNINEFISEKISSDEIVDGYFFRIIQFENFPEEKQKLAISSSGIIMNMYLPYHAYSCAIPAGFDRTKLKSLQAHSVIRWEAITKTQRELLGSIFPPYVHVEKGSVDLITHYHQNISLARAIALFQSKGLMIVNTSEDNQTITVRIPQSNFEKLRNLPFIYYIEPIDPPSIKDDMEGRSLHRSNVINGELTMGRHYDGRTVTIGLADDGTIGPHIDFTGRLTQHLTTNTGNHGDMTSGIAVGAGNLVDRIKGMGTGAYLHVFDINGYPQIVSAVNNYNNYGVTITSTSYSQGCNTYTAASQGGDNTLYNNTQLSFVFSAGNDGTTDCNYGAGNLWGNITGGYKMGKNVVTVGNLENNDLLIQSSSRGPASDGRIKPDICSNGGSQKSTDGDNTYQTGGGTSAACPGVAGCLSQIYQAYKELTLDTTPSAALIKAAVLNTAEDLGNQGPDFKFGWGRINALQAVKTLEDNHYYLDTIAQGQTDSNTVNIPANVKEFRLMVYWMDQGASPAASKALVNDLNLQVVDPSSTVYNPWILDPTPTDTLLDKPAVRGVDSLNNMEQVTIDNPVAGTYKVKVNGFQVPAANLKYVVVYEFLYDSITVTYPLGGEGWSPGQTEMIRWDACGDSGSFDIRYSKNNGTTWSMLTSGLPGDQRFYSWTVPIFASDQVLIEVSRNGISDVNDSNFTVIGTPTSLHVVQSCPDSVVLAWNAVPNATGYDVSMLGNKYMDFVGTTTSTSFAVTGTNPNSDYWFSVKALGPHGGKGGRANAIHKLPGLSNCQLSIDGSIQLLNPGGIVKSCQNGGSVPVIVNLHNAGILTLSNFSVSYSLNNGTVVTENFTDSIVSGATASFTFNQLVAITTPGNNNLKAWANISGDLYPVDDTLSAVLNLLTSNAATLPFVETFEAYGLCSSSANCGTTTCGIGGDWSNAQNNANDDIDWRTFQGSTPTTNTGPDVDHTTGNSTGNYIFLESSACSGKQAILLSPCFDLHGISLPRLTFWYHMFGSTMGQLHVDIIGETQTYNDYIPAHTSNTGNFWLKDSADLSPFTGQTIVVRFRGVTGSGDFSDMALDDIGVADMSTGIDEISLLQLTVYPNPGTGIFNYVTGNMTGNKQSIRVEDMLGKTILEKELSGGSTSHTGTIDLTNQSVGVYTVTLRSDKYSKQIKLVKMN